MSRVRPIISFLLLALLASGCVNTDVVMIDPSKSYAPTYGAQLIFEDPSQPHEVIAIIEGNGGIFNNQSDVLKKIQKKAADIGAHAVVPITSESEYVPPTVTQNVDGSLLTVPGGTKRTVKAAAIRFERQ